MLAIGVVIGLGFSFWLARTIVSLLYGVSAKPPGAFVGMALLLALVGCWPAIFPRGARPR